MAENDYARVLEKYFADIRHIETERHWFLATYAVVVAGVLTFLAQNDQQTNFIAALALLLLLALFGGGHSMRTTKVLAEIQWETKYIVKEWIAVEPKQATLAGRWEWPTLRVIAEEPKWYSDYYSDLRRLQPPHFVSISFYAYVIAAVASAVFLSLNIWTWN